MTGSADNIARRRNPAGRKALRLGRRSILLLTVLPLAAASVAWLTRPEADLLARSIRLTPDDTTFILPIWSSNDTLMFLRTVAGDREHIIELKIDSGKWKRLKPQDIAAGVYGNRVGEDRQLLVRYMLDRDRSPYLYASIGENAFVLFHGLAPGKNPFFAGIRDDQSGNWLSWFRDGPAEVVQPSDPRPVCRARCESLLNEGRFVGIRTHPAELLLYDGPNSEGLTFGFTSPRIGKLYSVKVIDGKPVVAKQPIRLPEGVEVGDVALSPDGARLAWLVYRTYASPGFMFWLAERIPAIRPEVKWFADFAVSRLGGSDWRRIGTLEYHPPMRSGISPVTCDYCPDLLMWRPDGRCVSFDYKGAIWMTRVD